MRPVARPVALGVSAILVPLLVSLCLVPGCATRSDLEALREDLRRARDVAWEAHRQASRARARAEIAARHAADALDGAARAEWLAESLDPAPGTVLRRPLRVADRVLVHKGERRLELYSGDELLRSFRIALGFEPVGHKRRQGDGRTPEGRYTLRGPFRAGNYGMGLLVSYPGPGDEARARSAGVRPGGGIFIHGLPRGLGIIGADHAKFDWTNGCIAVTDEEMEELLARVPEGTPIEILP